MKLVKEILYEKFTEESDPVTDLGIGGFSFSEELRQVLIKFDYNYSKNKIDLKQFFKNPKIKKYWEKRLNDWFLGRKVTGMFAKGNRDSYGGYQKQTTGKVIRIESTEFWQASGDPYSFDMLDFALITNEPGTFKVPDYWRNKDEVWYYHSYSDMHRRKLPLEDKIFINEKFTETSDPVRDLGIGTEEIVKQFKKELNDEWPTLTDTQDHFQYHRKEKFIRIDTYPLSYTGVLHLNQALKKIYPKYKDILKITRFAGYENNKKRAGVNQDVIIKIR